AARTVTFITNFLEMLRIDAFARAALDRSLDVVVRHALCPRHFDHAAKAGIARRVAAAKARRDADLFGEFAEDRAAFNVERTFSALDLRPFAVSRHGMGLKKTFAGQTCVARGVRNPGSLERRTIEEANRTPLNRTALGLS